MRYIDERQLAIDCAVEETREETWNEAIAQTARNMLAKGYSIAEIIGITALSRRQINALK